MNHSALVGAAVLLLTAPMAAVAAPSGAVQQASNQIDAGMLSGALLDAAHRLPATSMENDYLQVFLAEISTSGAPQVVVISAIDKAVGAVGLPKGALQALEALRKRSRQMDHTAALGKSDVFGAPAFTGGGGSDYAR